GRDGRGYPATTGGVGRARPGARRARGGPRAASAESRTGYGAIGQYPRRQWPTDTPARTRHLQWPERDLARPRRATVRRAADQHRARRGEAGAGRGESAARGAARGGGTAARRRRRAARHPGRPVRLRLLRCRPSPVSRATGPPPAETDTRLPAPRRQCPLAPGGDRALSRRHRRPARFRARHRPDRQGTQRRLSRRTRQSI
ncbi:MAG: hypothetical protein AVDCRST_MAG18-2675, partial [uncultured Thermomicrobiales bacterium]